MIKLMRVDHRLLHGQVAFSWTSAIGSDCILIANDGIFKDDIRMAGIKLAKPHGVKLVIKNIEDSIKALQSGVTDKYNLFIVVETIKDAYKMAKEVNTIKSINLGGTKSRENTKQISKAIFINEEEENMLKELHQAGIQIEIRQVPDDSKLFIQNALK